MTTLEPYPFSWLTDANLAARLDLQAQLDDIATTTYQAMLDRAERAAQDHCRREAASPAPHTAEAPTIDRDDPAVQLLSLHESAHATVAELLGFKASAIELYPDPRGVIGHAWIEGLDGASAYHRALILLAGPVAEARARAGPRGDVLAFLRGGAVEVAEARDLLGDGLRSALEHTRDLVCGSWLRIESLARRLLRDGVLDSRLGRAV